jgi:MraZ protein
VLVYPLADWQKLQDHLMNLPNLNSEARWLQRLMVGYATDLDIDSHGRVLIPGELREFTGLQRDAMLFGQGNHLELWDESAWKQASMASMKPALRSAAPAAGLDEVKLSAAPVSAPPAQK